jgi:hypothetical protein
MPGNQNDSASTKICDNNTKQIAFPGAEGFGRCAQGGRGGRVIEVTNLNDSGVGSLRDCIQQDGPRTCVFKTGGLIKLTSCTYCPATGCTNSVVSCPWPSITVANPYLTVAGQTATGDGIMVNGGFETFSHDIIFRHIRARPGFDYANHSAFFIRSSNTILDHVSAGWATDESITVLGMNGVAARDVTIQWSLVSESSHGIFIGGGNGNPATNISVHHNYMAMNWVRNPLLFAENGMQDNLVDVVNNVSYVINDSATSGACRGLYHHNYVNNAFVQFSGATYYGDAIRILGPDFQDDRCKYALYTPLSSIYFKGNIGYYRNSNSLPESKAVKFDGQPTPVSATRFPAPPISETDAFQAYKDVIAHAGARLPKLDAIDQRAISFLNGVTFQPGNVTHGSGGKVVDHESDVGGFPPYNGGPAAVDTDKDGMPDSFETQHGFNPNNSADGNMDKDGDGYTNFEEYLNNTNP